MPLYRVSFKNNREKRGSFFWHTETAVKATSTHNAVFVARQQLQIGEHWEVVATLLLGKELRGSDNDK